MPFSCFSPLIVLLLLLHHSLERAAVESRERKKMVRNGHIHSPTIHLKEHVDSTTKTNDQKTEGSISSCHHEETKPGRVANSEAPISVIGRKVMIVVDPSIEAKNALQWALTHTIQSHDIVVLLYYKKTTSKQGSLLATILFLVVILRDNFIVINYKLDPKIKYVLC